MEMYLILISLQLSWAFLGISRWDSGTSLVDGDLVPIQMKDILVDALCATKQDEDSDVEMEDLMNMETDEDETH